MTGCPCEPIRREVLHNKGVYPSTQMTRAWSMEVQRSRQTEQQHLVRETRDHICQQSTSLFTPFSPCDLLETPNKLLIALDKLPGRVLLISSGQIWGAYNILQNLLVKIGIIVRCQAILISSDTKDWGDLQNRNTARMSQMRQDMFLGQFLQSFYTILMCKHVD